MRDCIRGGLDAASCELTRTARVGVDFDEGSVPVPEAVQAACGFLGLDPLHVANEGRPVAFVPTDAADDVLAAIHAHEAGARAVRIGAAVDDHHGVVVARTSLGATRIVDLPVGEQLPRIC